MHALAAIAGCLLIGVALLDAFHTIVLARRTQQTFRLTRAFYRCTWRPYAAVARRIRSGRRREAFLGVYGPAALLLLFAAWTLCLIAGFALLQWAAGLEPIGYEPSFSSCLYLSATTFCTVATGDPQNGASKLITAIESSLGLGFLGLVISYLPVFYQAFADRELQISLLDARAGSPPSAVDLLQTEVTAGERAARDLERWEHWTAQLLESQLSFPMIAWFRSHHANQSWVTALTTITDSSAVLCLCAEGALRTQAELTFAMTCHALIDITAVFHLEDKPPEPDRLSTPDYSRLRDELRNLPSGIRVDRLSEERLGELRASYEPAANALGEYLLMSLPSWLSDPGVRENWRLPKGQRQAEVPFAVSDPFQASRE